jgi:hypothetical protein
VTIAVSLDVTAFRLGTPQMEKEGPPETVCLSTQYMFHVPERDSNLKLLMLWEVKAVSGDIQFGGNVLGQKKMK